MSRSTHTPFEIEDTYDRCPQYWKDSHQHSYWCSSCSWKFHVNDQDHEAIETESHTGEDVIYLHTADSFYAFEADLRGFPNKHVCPNCLGKWFHENEGSEPSLFELFGDL